MGTLIRAQGINSGMRIYNSQVDITVIITSIGEPRRDKRVALNLRGIPGKTCLEITPQDRMINLTGEIKVGVSSRTNTYNPKKVYMLYEAPREYTLDRIE